jgi:hypothetical protein
MAAQTAPAVHRGQHKRRHRQKLGFARRKPCRCSMTYMSSSSSNDGSSTITITFDVGYPLSIAAVDVQNRVAQAASSLPPT